MSACSHLPGQWVSADCAQGRHSACAADGCACLFHATGMPAVVTQLAEIVEEMDDVLMTTATMKQPTGIILHEKITSWRDRLSGAS
jgi:hypothetical protein